MYIYIYRLNIIYLNYTYIYINYTYLGMSPLRLEVQTGVMLGQPEEEPPAGETPISAAFSPVVCFPGRKHPRAEEEEEPEPAPFTSVDTLVPSGYIDRREDSLLIGIDNLSGYLTFVDWGDWDRNVDLICDLPSYRDTRWYVCWKIEGSDHPTELSGLHFGRDTKAYNGLVAANGGTVRGLRFQRVSGPEAACFNYVQEAREHNVPLFFSSRIFLWH